MTNTLAKMTALGLLAASFAFSGSVVYADTEDTTSIQVLTFDAIGNPGEIIAALDCDSEDGMGGCPVYMAVAEPPAADTTVADAFDPAVLEAAAEPTDTTEPSIRSVGAIIAEVHQTVMIAVQAEADGRIEEPAQTAAVAALAPEPITEDKTTSDATASLPNDEKAGQASGAIVIEITQSATVAVPGQPVDDEPMVTGSVMEPSPPTPISMLDGKNCDEDF